MKEKMLDLLGDYKFSDDGKVIITLNYGQRTFLKLMGENGIELNMENMKENTRDGIGKMKQMGLIKEIPTIGTSRCFYKATDLGMQIIKKMEGGRL